MSQQVTDFIKHHANNVIKSVKGTGILPSIKMAQMIIESSGKDEKGVFGIGKGLAVRKANNYFGIKADKNWKGNKIALSTPKDGKPVSYFRVYPSALDSLKDHSFFLLNNSRYKTNGVFTAKNPEQQAAALDRAKYSESPTYGKALLGLIKAYKLTELDGKKASNYAGVVLVSGAALLLVGAYYFRNDIKQVFTKN
jgi:flagellum-specific peptidoglycan hydrolase FlgJ